METRYSRHSSCLHVVVLGLSLLASNTASAIVVTLGDQDFSDGDFIANSLDFNAASAGEVAPFDAFMGNDFGTAADAFSASWTFSYASAQYTTGSLTLGIYDHDSGARGPQVGSFTIDGFDLTSELNMLFDGHGGTQQEYNVYSLDLPTLAMASFADGSATVSLSLIGPSLGGGPGTTSLEFFGGGNGAGLDFSTLNLVAVPEPGALLLMLTGLGLLVLMRRRVSVTP